MIVEVPLVVVESLVTVLVVVPSDVVVANGASVDVPELVLVTIIDVPEVDVVVSVMETVPEVDVVSLVMVAVPELVVV